MSCLQQLDTLFAFVLEHSLELCQPPARMACCPNGHRTPSQLLCPGRKRHALTRGISTCLLTPSASGQGCSMGCRDEGVDVGLFPSTRIPSSAPGMRAPVVARRPLPILCHRLRISSWLVELQPAQWRSHVAVRQAASGVRSEPEVRPPQRPRSQKARTFASKASSQRPQALEDASDPLLCLPASLSRGCDSAELPAHRQRFAQARGMSAVSCQLSVVQERLRIPLKPSSVSNG